MAHITNIAHQLRKLIFIYFISCITLSAKLFIESIKCKEISNCTNLLCCTLHIRVWVHF